MRACQKNNWIGIFSSFGPDVGRAGSRCQIRSKTEPVPRRASGRRGRGSRRSLFLAVEPLFSWPSREISSVLRAAHVRGSRFFFGKSRAGPPNARSRGRADELLTTLAPIVWTFFRNSAARPKRFLCLEAALFMRWRFVGKMSAPPPVERRSSHRAIKAPRSRDIGRARVIRSGLEAFNRRSTVFARSG